MKKLRGRYRPFPKHFKGKGTYHPSFQTRKWWSEAKFNTPPKCKSFIELRNAVVSTGLAFKPWSVRSFFSFRSILKTVVKLDEQSCQLLSANSEVNFLHFQSFAQVLFSVSVGTTVIPGRNWKQWLLSKKFGGGGKQDIFGNNVFHKQNKRYYMTMQRYKISFQVFSLILTQGEKFLYLQGGL